MFTLTVVTLPQTHVLGYISFYFSPRINLYSFQYAPTTYSYNFLMQLKIEEQK